MNPCATSRWGRVLVDAIMLYALYELGAKVWLIVIIGLVIALNTWWEYIARAMEDV